MSPTAVRPSSDDRKAVADTPQRKRANGEWSAVAHYTNSRCFQSLPIFIHEPEGSDRGHDFAR